MEKKPWMTSNKVAFIPSGTRIRNLSNTTRTNTTPTSQHTTAFNNFQINSQNELPDEWSKEVLQHNGRVAAMPKLSLFTAHCLLSKRKLQTAEGRSFATSNNNTQIPGAVSTLYKKSTSSFRINQNLLCSSTGKCRNTEESSDLKTECVIPSRFVGVILSFWVTAIKESMGIKQRFNRHPEKMKFHFPHRK